MPLNVCIDTIKYTEEKIEVSLINAEDIYRSLHIFSFDEIRKRSFQLREELLPQKN